jgi:TIR domain
LSKPAIFISYRRTDTRWFAATLCTRINQRLPGLSVFLDVASIEPGLDFEAALASTLDRAQVLLALIGRNWLTAQDQGGRRRLDLETDWVRVELARALEKGIRVIPVLVDGADMPSPEFLPSPLSALSRRQTCSVTFEEHDSGIERILGILAKTCEVPFVTSPDTGAAPLAATQPSATAVLGVFEENSTDNETLTVLAEHQLDRGRFALARSIFELVASREFRRLNGPPEVDALRARYQVARASLLLGESEAAVRDLEFILPYIDRERDQSYALYVRSQAALARAHLEEGRTDAAREVLPPWRGILFTDQSLTAVDAWIAHIEGRQSARDELLVQLDKEFGSHPPTVEFARCVSRLRETMGSASAAPTMIWKPDGL